MAESNVTVTVKQAWYVTPAFNIAGFFMTLAGKGIKVEVSGK